MTQPQQGWGAPPPAQHYAQPPQQQPWPANYQQQPAQAPGGWPQAAPAPQPQQPPTPPAPPVNTNYQWDDSNTDPTRGGGVSPAARELVGRTVIIAPKSIDESASYNGQSRPTAIVDLYVIDGGPLQYGSSQDPMKPRPATHVVETPAFFPGAMMGQSEIVKEIRTKLGKGLIVGIVGKGTRAFMIQRCDSVDNGEQRKAMAKQVWDAHHANTWTPPTPQPLEMAPAGYGVVNYGQPPQGQPQQWGAPVQQPAYPQPVPASAQQWLPPTPPAVPMPPGYDAVQWASFTPDQQQGIAAQYAAFLAQQGQPQPQQAPPSSPPGAPAAAGPPPGTQPQWS